MNTTYSDPCDEAVFKYHPGANAVLVFNDDPCVSESDTFTYDWVFENSYMNEAEQQKPKQGKGMNQRKNLEKMAKGKRSIRHERHVVAGTVYQLALCRKERKRFVDRLQQHRKMNQRKG